MSTQVLLDRADWRGDTASLSQQAHVLRVIYSGVFMYVPDTTALEFDMFSVLWAILVQDEDDSATGINSTAAGSLLQEARVIATGVVGLTNVEVATADQRMTNYPSHPIHVDTRARIKMRPGDQLRMCIQFQGDASSSLNVASCSAVSRVLIREP